MTLATHPDTLIHRCAPGCRHEPLPAPRTGGRCAYPDARHRSGLCDDEAVAVYVNPDAWPRNSYRCSRHDGAVIVEAAAALGFVRLPMGGECE